MTTVCIVAFDADDTALWLRVRTIYLCVYTSVGTKHRFIHITAAAKKGKMRNAFASQQHPKNLSLNYATYLNH